MLHYQPQYRVDNGSLSGVEALLRWQKTDGTAGAPGEFIPHRRRDHPHPGDRLLG